jgi:ATP-dependent Lon protease
MIIKAPGQIELVVTDKQESYPVLPLRTAVLFPGLLVSLQITREENARVIKSCHSAKKEIVASYSPNVPSDETTPVCQVGVLARLHDVRQGAGDTLLVTLEGIKRVSIEELTVKEKVMYGSVADCAVHSSQESLLESKVAEVIATVNEISQIDPTYAPEQSHVLARLVKDPSLLADKTAYTFHFPLSAKQEILETVELSERYTRLLTHLKMELNQASTLHSINAKVKESIADDQKKYFLRQQLHEIRRQLGDDFTEEREVARLRVQLRATSALPAEAHGLATIELDRLEHLSTASAEYGNTKNYLDWLLAMPWGKCQPESYEIKDAQRILNNEYFGPQNLKEQILQRLSVRKLLGGVNEGPTLCLVGAPGTGKAALARSIAKSMGKDFVRLSVGGITDVADVTGEPRTFLGALPGKIVRTIRDCGSCDPVVLIEDLDHFNVQNDSSVNMALLEALDTRKNNRFLDRYLGIPFDLSKVFFICSARSMEELPEQFMPRLEIVELPGYIEKEKIVISQRYIIPDLLKKHGITRTELKFSDKVLTKLITGYTQEAGLLAFSQQIEKICRKIALEKAEKRRSSWTVNEKNLESYLGLPDFFPEKMETKAEIGIAAGLAWTGAGGELMFIEGLKMKGEGRIITTGSLGEVMRESIQAAHSYVRSRADMLAIDFMDFDAFDIHIHFPSGAIPKDGPSAGAAVCLVIASILAERPIRNDIGMTGEVTLRGKVLPVAGIKEKVSAAYRAGMSHVAMPKENQKDIRELPKEIQRKITFHLIEKIDELFELCLLDFTPSTYTLEKIFTEEIEKAKRRRKGQNHRRRVDTRK